MLPIHDVEDGMGVVLVHQEYELPDGYSNVLLATNVIAEPSGTFGVSGEAWAGGWAELAILAKSREVRG